MAKVQIKSGSTIIFCVFYNYQKRFYQILNIPMCILRIIDSNCTLLKNGVHTTAGGTP